MHRRTVLSLAAVSVAAQALPHVSNAQTSDFQSGGLGLSISRAIVETHGGTLELQPTPEGETGARFAVTLPGA